MLAVVGIAITAAVYGVVALIVKADDMGLAMATHARTGAGRAFGRGIVVAVPYVLSTLSIVGTAAMIWVGGGIVVHGLTEFGFPQIDHVIEGAAHAVEVALPFAAGLASRTHRHRWRRHLRPRPRAAADPGRRLRRQPAVAGREGPDPSAQRTGPLTSLITPAPELQPPFRGKTVPGPRLPAIACP